MRWKIDPPPPGPRYGDRRIVNRFALLPKKTRSEWWVWLEHYWSYERWGCARFMNDGTSVEGWVQDGCFLFDAFTAQELVAHLKSFDAAHVEVVA